MAINDEINKQKKFNEFVQKVSTFFSRTFRQIHHARNRPRNLRGDRVRRVRRGVRSLRDASVPAWQTPTPTPT